MRTPRSPAQRASPPVGTQGEKACRRSEKKERQCQQADALAPGGMFGLQIRARPASRDHNPPRWIVMNRGIASKCGCLLLMLIAPSCWGQTPGRDGATRPPRRLSVSLKSELAACLRNRPGQFSIAAIANNSEAYTYAQDWRDVFLSAGWKSEQQEASIQVFRISGGKWPGMRVSVHDDSPEQGQTSLAGNSPEQNFERCVAGKHDIPAGGRIISYKTQPSGSLSLQVSVQPQP